MFLKRKTKIMLIIVTFLVISLSIYFIQLFCMQYSSALSFPLLHIRITISKTLQDRRNPRCRQTKLCRCPLLKPTYSTLFFFLSEDHHSSTKLLKEILERFGFAGFPHSNRPICEKIVIYFSGNSTCEAVKISSQKLSGMSILSSLLICCSKATDFCSRKCRRISLIPEKEKNISIPSTCSSGMRFLKCVVFYFLIHFNLRKNKNLK